VIDIEHIKTAT